MKRRRQPRPCELRRPRIRARRRHERLVERPLLVRRRIAIRDPREERKEVFEREQRLRPPHVRRRMHGEIPHADHVFQQGKELRLDDLAERLVMDER